MAFLHRYLCILVVLRATNVFASYCDGIDHYKNWKITTADNDFDMVIANTTWDFGWWLFDGTALGSNIANSDIRGNCFPSENWTDDIKFDRNWSDYDGKKHFQRFIGYIDWNNVDGYTMSGWYCNENDLTDDRCNIINAKWQARPHIINLAAK